MMIERIQHVNQQQKRETKDLRELLKMKENEMEIIAMLGQGSKIQYSSFESKYNTFKQMMTNFITTNQELEEIIMEKFDQYLKPTNQKNEQVKPDKKITNKHEKTSTHRVKDKQNKKNGKQQVISNEIKKKLRKQKMVEDKPVLKKRGLKKKQSQSQQSSEQQSESQQQYGDKTSGTLNIVQELRRRPVSDHDMVIRKESLKMEQKIQWVEQVVSERRFIPKLSGNIVDLLLLPHGVLQKLMDYNSSVQYGSGGRN